MAEAKSIESTSLSTEFSLQYLYRSLRKDEDIKKGLAPRDDSATCTVLSHLSGKAMSQFISTTASLDASTRWAQKSINKRLMIKKEVRIVEIDVIEMKKSNVRIIDLTDSKVLDKEIPDKVKHKKQRNYATCYKEILIEGNIKPECIKLVDQNSIILVDPDDVKLSQLTDKTSELKISK